MGSTCFKETWTKSVHIALFLAYSHPKKCWHHQPLTIRVMVNTPWQLLTLYEQMSLVYIVSSWSFISFRSSSVSANGRKPAMIAAEMIKSLLPSIRSTEYPLNHFFEKIFGIQKMVKCYPIQGFKQRSLILNALSVYEK